MKDRERKNSNDQAYYIHMIQRLPRTVAGTLTAYPASWAEDELANREWRSDSKRLKWSYEQSDRKKQVAGSALITLPLKKLGSSLWTMRVAYDA